MFYWSNINLICNNFRHNFCFQKHSKIGKHPSWFWLRKQFSDWTTKSKLLLSPSLNCSLEKVPYEFCRCKWKTNPIVFFLVTKGEFFSGLYLWALHEVISGNASEFRSKIDQSERDTRGRPLLKLHKSFFDFPTSEISLVLI